MVGRAATHSQANGWQRIILALVAWCAVLWLFPERARAQSNEACVESPHTLCSPISGAPGETAHAVTSQAPRPVVTPESTAFELEQAPMCGADASSVNAPPPLMPPSHASLRASPADDEAGQDQGLPGFTEPRARQAGKPEIQRALPFAWPQLGPATSTRVPRLYPQGSPRSGVISGLYRPPRRA